MPLMMKCFNTASGKYYCNLCLNRLNLHRLQHCFNTASGKYYCNTMIFERLLQQQWRFNTASGKYYCNLWAYVPWVSLLLWPVSIPQAVSTIAMKWKLLVMAKATQLGFNTASGKYYCNFIWDPVQKQVLLQCFNTASGKYYCNDGDTALVALQQGFNTASGKYYCNTEELIQKARERMELVSIPQAVSTIAML